MNEETKSIIDNLSRVFGADRLVSKDDIAQTLKGLKAILDTYKKETISLNNETTEIVEQVFDKIVKEHKKLKDEVLQETSNSKKEISEKIKISMFEMDVTIKEIKSLIKEAKSIEYRDGKDADEEKIVQDVLAQIKLPEYTETILDNGEEIVIKINELPTETDEYKIDASHIKNLPVTKGYGGSKLSYADNISITGDGTPSNPLIGNRVTVQHGADANYARPNVPYVDWYGTVEPNNAELLDNYIDIT